ncbi:MAG: hypothetical protein CBD18_07955 [Opitutales bacterium TMED158]|nr:MAG: hypothetical protein CBD18_07955 [Opitutales bacterium TMED158]
MAEPYVRSARPRDVNRILEMIRGIAEYEKLAHQLETDESRLHESLFGENPVPRALVAEHEGFLVGYAIFFYNYSTFVGRPGIYLEDLYVDVNYRGKGYGNALFKAVTRIAYDENCGRMEWVALDWNDSALEFYRERGAQQLDEWRLLRFARPELEALVDKQ